MFTKIIRKSHLGRVLKPKLRWNYKTSQILFLLSTATADTIHELFTDKPSDLWQNKSKKNIRFYTVRFFTYKKCKFLYQDLDWSTCQYMFLSILEMSISDSGPSHWLMPASWCCQGTQQQPPGGLRQWNQPFQEDTVKEKQTTIK